MAIRLKAGSPLARTEVYLARRLPGEARDHAFTLAVAAAQFFSSRSRHQPLDQRYFHGRKSCFIALPEGTMEAHLKVTSFSTNQEISSE